MSSSEHRAQLRFYSNDQLKELCGFNHSDFDRLADYLQEPWRVQHARIVESRRKEQRINRPGAGRPGLPFRSQLLIALVYLRGGHGYRSLAAWFNVGKDPAWRAVNEITEVMGAEGTCTPDGAVIRTAEDFEAYLSRLAARRDESDKYTSSGGVIIDGSFTQVSRPQGWKNQKRYFSYFRKVHCLTFQVVSNLYGDLLWLSEHSVGSTHDLTALAESTASKPLKRTAVPIVADKAYQGISERLDFDEDHWVVTPSKKPRTKDLSDIQKEVNTAIASVRVRVEHLNGRIKKWRIMNFFRRTEDKYDMTLRAVGFLVTFLHRV